MLRLTIASQYFQGNREAWKVHMNGMKKIVELRGGIDKLPRAIQQKIYGLVIHLLDSNVRLLIVNLVAPTYYAAWSSAPSLISLLLTSPNPYLHPPSTIYHQP